MVRRLNFAVWTLMSAGLLAGCESKNAASTVRARDAGPVVVEGFLVKPSIISEDVEVSGTVLPFEETRIRSEVSGRIVQLNIPEGADVPRGFLLVKLFDEDLRAQLSKLEVQLQIAVKTVERQRELLAISGISQQDFDLSALTVDNLKADIRTTRIAISKTEIRAPYAGQIGLRSMSLGAYISPSDIITTLRDVKQLKLEFSIPEKYASGMSKGHQVQFRIDGGLRSHHAVILATEGNVDPNTRTLKVRALVSTKDPEIVPGVFAKVNLQLGKDTAALMVPTQAVIPYARNKQVIVLRKDSAVFKIVETGIRDSAYLQVTRGLQSGDTIITTGLMAIRPGGKVRIRSVKQLQDKK